MTRPPGGYAPPMPSHHGDQGWGCAALTAACAAFWIAVLTVGLLAYCHRYGG